MAAFRLTVATTLALCLAAAFVPADELQRDGAFVGGVFSYAVRRGDTLGLLGARFAVPVPTLARRNGLIPTEVLGDARLLSIDNRHIVPALDGRALILNVPQRLLYFSADDGLHAYPVAVGTRGWPTPIGPFEVTERETDPAWDVPLSIQDEMRRQGKPVLTRVPPGPDNPLGSRFIRLSFDNIGVHGTPDPSSIYRFISHGCIRMHRDDIASLFPRVTVGMSGVSIYEPVLMVETGGHVYLEVHPDVYRLAAPPLQRAQALAERLGVTDAIDWVAAEQVTRLQEGTAVDVTLPAQ